MAQNGQTIPCSGWCRLSCAKDLISLSRWFSFFCAPHYRSARCSQAFASGEGPEQDTHMPTDQSRIAAAWQSPFSLQGLAGGARGSRINAHLWEELYTITFPLSTLPFFRVGYECEDRAATMHQGRHQDPKGDWRQGASPQRFVSLCRPVLALAVQKPTLTLRRPLLRDLVQTASFAASRKTTECEVYSQSTPAV